MTAPLVVRNADWLVACDAARGGHVYLRNADLAFAGDTITYVGPRYEGEAAGEIDGRERLVIPGLVNVHSHPSSEPLRKGITDETLSPGFHHSSLYEFLTAFDNDAEGRVACLRVALAELMLSGCTTVTDLSSPYDEWLDTLAASGIRAVVAPGFRDARWLTRNGHAIEYAWDDAAGKEAFERARTVIDPRRAAPLRPVERDGVSGPDRHLPPRHAARRP